MKPLIKILCLFVIVFTCFACITMPAMNSNQNSTPPGPMELSDTTPLSIILPNDNSIYELQNGIFSGFRLSTIQEQKQSMGGVFKSNGRSPYDFWGFRFSKSGNLITLKKVKGFNANTGYSNDKIGYISYILQQDTFIDGGNFKITLTPIKKKKKLHYGEYDPGDFTTQEWHAYVATLQIHCKIEIDSDYPAESIKSNFDRNYEKSKYYLLSFPNTVAKKLAPAYVLHHRGAQIIFSAISSPYRNGSKTVINYDVPIVFTSENEINCSIVLDEINLIFKNTIAE